MPNLLGSRIAGGNTAYERSKSDFYPTPPEVTYALLDFLKLPESKTVIWEPACGEGHMVNQIKKMGYDVFGTDVFYGDPLTLEQLRNMDGKPVWIVESPDWGHWELSEDAEDYILDRDTDLYGLTYPDPDGKAGLHKLGWIAYAYPPSHIDREAWTAEWLSEDVGEDIRCQCSKCGYPVSYFWGKTAFCPGCGRAMTPEAWAELEKRMGG